ncbi:Protein of unknown function [Pyronema omphalodes CBS 100304]|uniref:Uncharacterized protein n=1 Tax=Pyronema omphalodes (strain CBS 100304) TaxID=1076935 RepID=U4LFL6_PYROM|nr:Protein of unknown function [Pyronema omphalodes CBS 100304]
MLYHCSFCYGRRSFGSFTAYFNLRVSLPRAPPTLKEAASYNFRPMREHEYTWKERATWYLE